MWRDRDAAQVTEHQRIPVGRRLGDVVGSDRATGAGPVLDDHGLLQDVAQLLPDHPTRDIRAPAWRERDDQPQRPRRPALRQSRVRNADQHDKRQKNSHASHLASKTPDRFRLRSAACSTAPWHEEIRAGSAPAWCAYNAPGSHDSPQCSGGRQRCRIARKMRHTGERIGGSNPFIRLARKVSRVFLGNGPTRQITMVAPFPPVAGTPARLCPGA